MSALGYFFFGLFWDNWVCLVRGETDFVKFWVESDQNNPIEGWPKFDILKVRGLRLVVT